MKPAFWMLIGVIVVALLAFAGLAPLPGQKDEPTPFVDPAPPGQGPEPTAPSGPPHSRPGERSVPQK